jgi:hypothetical protein
MSKEGLGLYNDGTGHRSCHRQAFHSVFYAFCMTSKPGLPSRALQAQSLGYELFYCL